MLYDPDRAFDFVITELALRLRPGSADVQVGQYDPITVSTLPTVFICVLSTDAPAAGFTRTPW